MLKHAYIRYMWLCGVAPIKGAVMSFNIFLCLSYSEARWLKSKKGPIISTTKVFDRFV